MVHSDSTSVRSRFLEIGVVIDEVGSYDQRSKKCVSGQERGRDEKGKEVAKEGKERSNSLSLM